MKHVAFFFLVVVLPAACTENDSAHRGDSVPDSVHVDTIASDTVPEKC